MIWDIAVDEKVLPMEGRLVSLDADLRALPAAAYQGTATYLRALAIRVEGQAPVEELELLAADARRQGIRPETVDAGRRLALAVRGSLDRGEQRDAGLRALVDTARELARQDGLDALLQVVARRARLVLGADLAFVSILADDGTTPRLLAADGASTPISAGYELPLGRVRARDSLPGAPLWTSDYLADRKVARDPRTERLIRAEGLRAVLAVQLHSGGAPVGTLHAADRRVRHFTAAERALLAELGELAGIAIDQALRAERADAQLGALTDRLAAARTELRSVEERDRIRNRLMDVALAGGTLHELVAEADRAIDGAVAVCSPTGELLATSGSMPPENRTAMVAAAAVAGELTETTASAPAARDIWTVPVIVGEDRIGSVLVRPRRRPLARLPLTSLGHAVAMLLRVDGSDPAGLDRARTDLLDDLLDGRRGIEQLERPAQQLGLDLGQPHVVVVARSGAPGRRERLDRAAAHARRYGGLFTRRDGMTTLLLPGTDAGAAARAVLDALSSGVGAPVTVGASRPVRGPRSVPAAHREAARCLQALVAIGATGHSASVDELGLVGVLLSDRRDVQGFVTDTLGPLLAHDRDRRTELTSTLDAYFASGNSPQSAAKRLHVHPNTVARRLERIRELVPDWKDADRALDIQLALRVLRVQDALRAAG